MFVTPYLFRAAVAACLLSAGTSTFAQVQFNLGGVVSYSAAVRAQDIDRGDLDGDGDIDLVSASRGDGKIAAYFNDGFGGFGPQVMLDSSAVEVLDVDVLDLDGDGDNDIVYAIFQNGRITWLINDGAGNFSAPAVLVQNSFTGACSAICVADLDHDQDLDLIAIQYPGTGVYSFYLQGPPGTFTYPGNTIYSVQGGQSVAAGDLDGDGWDDVVGGGSNGLTYRPNTGTLFVNPLSLAQSFGAATNIVDVVLSDLGNDGDLDVIAASAGSGGIYAYSNDGLGHMDSGSLLASMAGISGLTLGDVNGDGMEDLVATSSTTHTIEWFAALGGTFDDIGIVIANDAFGAQAVCVADFTGDGVSDVAAASDADDDVAWYKQLPLQQWSPAHLLTAPAGNITDAIAADLDGDGLEDAVLLL